MIYISFLSVVGAYVIRTLSLNDKHSCQLFRMGLRDKTMPTLTTPLLRANMTCAVATIFSSLAFLSSSISMANLSRLVAASFSSFALLSFSVSTANLSGLLATTQQKMICYMRCVNAFFIDITIFFVNMTDFSCHFNQKDTLRIPNECLCVILTHYFLLCTFSSLKFLSNSLSSPRFNLLIVARCCFSWSSVSDDLFFPSSVFFGSPSCSIFFASYPQPFSPLFFNVLSSVCFKFLTSK